MDSGVVTPPPKQHLRDVRSWLRPATVEHLITGLIAVLGAFWAMRWNLSDLDQPLRVGESELSSIYALADGFQAPFIYSSAEYGYPFSANFAVQVVPDDVTNTLIGLLKWASGSPIIAVNSFILLSFALTASAMLSLLRRYINWPILRVVFALSAAWMPYVFVRIEYGHVLLSSIWPIPLAIGLIIDTVKSQPPISRGITKSLFLAIAVGASSSYYGFFSALILALLSIAFLFERPINRRHFLLFLSKFLVVGGFLAPLAIRLVSMKWMGLEQPITRSAEESLQYAGRLIDIFIPVDFPLKMPTSLLTRTRFEWSPIHTFGSAGVLTAFLMPRRHSKDESYLKMIIIISTVFFATGGLGYIFATLVTPSFRAWSRLMPFIAIASLTLFAIFVQRLLSGRGRRFSALLLVVLTLPLGLQLELARKDIGSDLEDRAPDELLSPYLSGSDLTAALVPKKCPILQIPIMRAFEGGDVGSVRNGDHYWPGILSSSSRWTYGAIKGTTSGEFLPSMRDSNADRVIQWSSTSEICSIWVDTRATSVDALSNPSAWTDEGLNVSGQFGVHVIISK